MERPDLVEQLYSYLSSRPVTAASIEELVTDFRDFVRLAAPNDARTARVRREHEGTPQLPAALRERVRHWEEARLRTLQTYVAQARESLGFTEAPFPRDTDLVKEIWYWLTTPNPRHFVTSPSSPAARLGEAVKLLLPRRWPEVTGKSLQESQWDANRTALRNFEFNANLIADYAGIDGQAAAVWILAGVSPSLDCVKVSKSATFNGPTTVVMRINPDVVKPEEVSSLYRQMRKVGDSSDDRLRTFALEDGVPIREWSEERLERWNARYPLARFKNVDSARVAASRADRSRRRLSREERVLQGRARIVEKDHTEREVDATITIDEEPDLALIPKIRYLEDQS